MARGSGGVRTVSLSALVASGASVEIKKYHPALGPYNKKILTSLAAPYTVIHKHT